MNQKQYPRPVVLKKWLVGGAMMVVVVTISLTGVNLIRSSHGHQAIPSRVNQTIETTATKEDVERIQIKAMTHQEKPTPIKIQSTQSRDDQRKNSNEAKQQEAQHIQQDILQAMSAPISSNQITGEKFERGMESSTTHDAHPLNLNNAESDQNRQGEKIEFLQSHSEEDNPYLSSLLESPMSPYELQAGTIIPGILISGINSDLPGQITGQVRSNVYDSITGKYLLIPQGARITGIYDSQIVYGQERVLVAWKRIIFPNGQSMNLKGMPGIDMSGYAGMNDRVDNHYAKLFGSVVLLSVIGAGAQLAQPQNTSNPFAAPTVGQTLAQSIGNNLANTSMIMTNKNINIQPTLEIRPGYKFNISVTKDMVLPGPYHQQE